MDSKPCENILARSLGVEERALSDLGISGTAASSSCLGTAAAAAATAAAANAAASSLALCRPAPRGLLVQHGGHDVRVPLLQHPVQEQRRHARLVAHGVQVAVLVHELQPIRERRRPVGFQLQRQQEVRAHELRPRAPAL